MILLVSTRLVRHGKSRCHVCRRRRILFSLITSATEGQGVAETPRLCAECAGIVVGPQLATSNLSQEPDTVGL